MFFHLHKPEQLQQIELDGTLLGAGLGTLGAVGNRLNPDLERRYNDIVETRQKDLKKLEEYISVKKVVNKAKDQGVDLLKLASEDDYLVGSVNKDGKINTVDTAIPILNDRIIMPYESSVSDLLAREGSSVNIKDVYDYLIKSVKTSKDLEGASLESALRKVRADVAGYARRAKDGRIPLTTIHNAKVNKYATLNYFNPESKVIDKTIAKGLKDIVELYSGENVQEINRELSKYYALQDLFEKLDGKVVKGGKLGKYFAQTLGGIVGSKFGPIGAIIGAETAGQIKGAQMASKFSKATGKQVQPPEVLVKAGKKAGSPRLALPAGNKSGPRSQISNTNVINVAPRIVDEAQAPSANQSYSSRSLGNRNTIQSTTITPVRNAIVKLSLIPKGTSIDKVRNIVNNHLETTLQAIADPDTFDMILDNPTAFYKQQIDDISMGLKAENPKYAKVSKEINKINPENIENFEELAESVRKILKRVK